MSDDRSHLLLSLLLGRVPSLDAEEPPGPRRGGPSFLFGPMSHHNAGPEAFFMEPPEFTFRTEGPQSRFGWMDGPPRGSQSYAPPPHRPSPVHRGPHPDFDEPGANRLPLIFLQHLLHHSFAGGDMQMELGTLFLPSILQMIEAQQNQPAFPPLTNAEKEFLEYEVLSLDLANNLGKAGYDQCTVCQENFLDMWKDYEESTKNTEESTEEPLERIFVCRLPCNHFFCKECLLKWMSYTSTCPNCRLVLGGLREKYSTTSSDMSTKRPEWWHGTDGLEELESCDDEESPIKMHFPQPPSVARDSSIVNPRHFRVADEGTSPPPPAPQESQPSFLAAIPSASIEAEEVSLLDSASLVGPSSPHQSPTLPLGDDTAASQLRKEERRRQGSVPRGNGARAVRRLRDSRREPSREQGRKASHEVRVGEVVGEQTLFPRIRLSRQHEGNRMRTVRVAKISAQEGEEEVSSP